MKRSLEKVSSILKCAIYTRKSSEEGLEQSFNSLHAQREACEAYIKSQRHEGWAHDPTAYDDGGYSGGTMDRPALTRLISEIRRGMLDIILVYKVDRLSRSLADFVRLVELFDKHGVSFVSVTQQFNTATSMGRLTLNVLLSFAQFEREVTGERIRDKIAASKQKGMWMGGVVPLGYDIVDKRLVLNEEEARTVRHIYTRYLALGCVRKLKSELDAASHVSKVRETEKGLSGGRPFSRGALYKLLKNPLYIGKITHKGTNHEGQHAAAVDSQLWQQVQIKLSSNRLQKTRKTLAKNPALLAGLLHDDRGNPMSPTHATKGNRRYRYYISQAVLQFRGTEAGGVIRTSAQPLENAVIGQIKQLLGDSLMLLDALSSVELSAPLQTRLITAAKSLVDGWESLHSGQIIDIIKTFIRKIVLSKDQVRITCSRVAIVESLLENKLTETDSNALHQTPDEYVITTPVNLKRCGLETRLIIPGEIASQTHARTVTAVQDALAKALAWNQALITGTASSMTELGKQEGVTQQYIAQVIKLAFLSPDIMKAIIKGDIPSTLTLDILKKGFPLDWGKQRQMLGFTHLPPSNPTGKIGI